MSRRVELPLLGPPSGAANPTADVANSTLPDYSNPSQMINMWPTLDSKGGYYLVSAPGTSSYTFLQTELLSGSGVTTYNGRGMGVFADSSSSYAEKIGCVVNNGVVIVDALTESSPGTVSSAINTTFGLVDVRNFQSAASSQLVWSNHRSDAAGVGYYDPATDTQDIAATIGSNFANGSPYTFDIINRQIVGEDEQSWASSAPASLQVDTTNRLAEAEAFPDRIRRVIVTQPYLYVFGQRSTEVYQNTGSGKPPFSRVPTGVLSIGLGQDRNAVGVFEDMLFFIDQQGRPMMLRGLQAQYIGTPRVWRLLRGFILYSDTRIMPFIWNGSLVVMFNMMKQNSASDVDYGPCLVYHVDFNMWSDYGLYNGSPLGDIPGDYCSFGGVDAVTYLNKVLFLHSENGRIIELDEASNSIYLNSSSNSTSDMVYSRVTESINSSVLGAEPDQLVYMSRLILRTTPGSTTSAVTPTSITMQYSDDGGITWSTSKTATMGVRGDHGIEVFWTSLGRFRNRIFRFAFTDASLALYGLFADISIGGS